MSGLHPLKRRLLAAELTRLRRADEQLRFVTSQRFGRIDPNPHQIDAVVFALKRIPEGGCILADEVGLGKTIEAGLVIAQLLAEGMRRILLIVPKSLVGQWQTELYSLFGIETREGRADPEAFAGDGVFLVHREFAGGLRGAPLLSSADAFDLVIIDEAHEIFAGIYKRYDKAGNYNLDSSEAQIADRVRSFLKPTGTPVLLLTATPIQNSIVELWGLVQYVEQTDQLLGKLPTFREVFCDGSDRSLNEDQTFELRRRLESVVQRTLRRQAQEFLEVPFVERQAKLIEYSMSPDEKRLYDDVTAWLLDPYLCSFGGRNRRLLLIGFHRRMGSSLAALRASLVKVAERLRRELAGQSDKSWDDLVEEMALEFEEDLDDVPELATEAADESPADELPSVERFRAELVRVEGFIASAQALDRDSKAVCLLDTLLKVIRERGDSGEGTVKVVIFTESVTTQEFLFELLTSNGYLPTDITLFRGQNDHARARDALRRWEEDVGRVRIPGHSPSRSVAVRLALVHEFREHSKVFISTEAGAKGLNLQFCETLINYDLPWNPQRIEQRIGRVHRYGQRRGVTVLNFLDRGNEAQQLTFDILSQKLDLFGKVLDASDVVLHKPDYDFPEPLISGLGVEFERQLRQIYQRARSIEEVTEQLRELRRSLDSKREEFDREQARASELISGRLDDSVRQVFKKWQSELPAGLERLDRDLDQLLGAFLTAIGATHKRTESDGRIEYQLEPNSSLPDGYQVGGRILIGRLRGITEGDLFHPGHPLFVAAVEEARNATARPLHIEFRSSDGSLPECLRSCSDQAGRLIVTKVSYRGFQPVDHILVTALLEHQLEPLGPQTLAALLSLEICDAVTPETQLQIDDGAILDAIDEAILEDQSTTMVEEETHFVRKLEQLDRYLEDQILVLRRQQLTLSRKLEEEELKKERATSPASQRRASQSIESLQAETQKLEDRIERLRQGQDTDYEQWRSRLFERRFRQPQVERILEATFRVVGGDAPC